jgi:cell shape-determining protein MreC
MSKLLDELNAIKAELDALRARNARLREALAFYVRIRAQPVELVKDFGNTAEAALEWKP